MIYRVHPGCIVVMEQVSDGFGVDWSLTRPECVDLTCVCAPSASSSSSPGVVPSSSVIAALQLQLRSSAGVYVYS